MSTNYRYLPGCINTPTFVNRSKPGGVYDKITTGFAGMDSNAIANAELNWDFFWFNFSQAWSSNYSFRGIETKQYTGNLFGEIIGQAHGTHIGAQGNHFVGNDLSKPKLLDDYTKTKCTIVLGCPSFATPAISDLFYNQICTLSSVRDANKEKEIRSDSMVIPKEMVKSLKPGGEPDGTILTGPPLYTVLKRDSNSDSSNSSLPNSPMKRNLKKRNWSASNDNETQEHEDIQLLLLCHLVSEIFAIVYMSSYYIAQQIYAGAEYDHQLMPNFGGPVFTMKQAKLIQPQWTNINNDLIVPWEYYKHLRPGTVIIATICIEVFVMPAGSGNSAIRKIYHASITFLKVIAESDVVILPPTPFITKKIADRLPELSSSAAMALATIDWLTSPTPPSTSGSDHTLEDANDNLESNVREGSERPTKLKVVLDGSCKTWVKIGIRSLCCSVLGADWSSKGATETATEDRNDLAVAGVERCDP
ncbi:hypothetical protein C8J55DRAFT_564736 [Lentinula edodes]|uniref:Uncharacterized protein n=1 Tax=Lentinula lateritia TaxID=40482 RepID=A0A9W8ZW54_9AGAR|nr:hypothetical protein C8J55DRAFT_564736 [Lentinula edodes]